MARVLIVDDGKPLIRLMSWELEQEGFHVVPASVVDAIQIAAEQEPDCIVLNMLNYAPTLLEQFKQATPKSSIVGVPVDSTGLVDVKLEVPFAIADLSERIREVCS